MKTLGYPTTTQSMEKRLNTLLPRSDYQTFVYEREQKLLGMIGMMFSYAYHTEDTHVRVIAFVVSEQAQGKGIGRLLLNETEQWARKKGANRVTLNSGNRSERSQAHSIYNHLGFEGRATGFYKEIESEPYP
nr:GNAT family N-acetyltransferase [Halobacillus sp. A5]